MKDIDFEMLLAETSLYIYSIKATLTREASVFDEDFYP
jgi:hypothetical protein